jgi:hypothetical protein
VQVIDLTCLRDALAPGGEASPAAAAAAGSAALASASARVEAAFIAGRLSRLTEPGVDAEAARLSAPSVGDATELAVRRRSVSMQRSLWGRASRSPLAVFALGAACGLSVAVLLSRQRGGGCGVLGGATGSSRNVIVASPLRA